MLLLKTEGTSLIVLAHRYRMMAPRNFEDSNIVIILTLLLNRCYNTHLDFGDKLSDDIQLFRITF